MRMIPGEQMGTLSSDATVTTPSRPRMFHGALTDQRGFRQVGGTIFFRGVARLAPAEQRQRKSGSSMVPPGWHRQRQCGGEIIRWHQWASRTPGETFWRRVGAGAGGGILSPRRHPARREDLEFLLTLGNAE